MLWIVRTKFGRKFGKLFFFDEEYEAYLILKWWKPSVVQEAKWWSELRERIQTHQKHYQKKKFPASPWKRENENFFQNKILDLYYAQAWQNHQMKIGDFLS